MLHLTESDYNRIVSDALSEAQDTCGKVRTEVEIAKDNDAFVLVEVEFGYERELTDAGLGYTDVKTDIYGFSVSGVSAYDGGGDPTGCDFSEEELDKAYKDMVRFL